MNFENHLIGDNIHLLLFDNQEEVASTFIRFQEYYESPEFQGENFTLDEYKEWYASNHGDDGEFTYYEDWNGFNIPSYILDPFYEGRFDPLRDKEEKFLEFFQDKEDKFYVIGTHKELDEDRVQFMLEHEPAHALFYFDEEYKNKAMNIIEDYDVNDLKEELRDSGGYSDSVLIDEVNAYSVGGLSPSMESEIPEGLEDKLRDLFSEYAEKYNVDTNLENYL